MSLEGALAQVQEELKDLVAQVFGARDTATQRVAKLEKIIQDAPHGFMCRSSRYQREHEAAAQAGLKEWTFFGVLPEPPDEQHCNCWKSAAREN